ncbi:type VII secretion protein EccE [Tsukamurella strandjordii]|uniref:type VII secretion protein EccE n=1 Tax=Tsukamurella strandjordii TaxID=147577 RepID=UPI0031D15D4B
MEQTTGFTRSVTGAVPAALAAPTRWERHRWPAAGAILLAEASAAVAGLGTAAAGGPHWAAGLAALTVGGAALTRRRGTSAAEWATGRLRRPARSTHATAAAPYPGGGDIGIRHENGLITAVLRPTMDVPRIVAVRGRDDPSLPLDVLARVLRHADTPAARIDVLLAGGRAPSGPIAPRTRYQMLLGPIARWAVSDLRIAVSIDPTACAPAIARRRGDAAATAALAARRVADALAAEGIPTLPVGSAELASIVIESPEEAVHADPDALAAGDLDHLLGRADPFGTAVITVRPGDVRRAGGTPDVRVEARLYSSGLVPGDGDRNAHAVSGTEPALRTLHVPLAGCGQMLGADTTGGPVSTRLHGPGVRTVWASVADDPARQLVERAVATGARVLIVTGRPALWEPLVGWVDSPEALWISGWRYPPHLAHLSPADYTVTVLDGTASGLAPGSVEPTGTVWRIEGLGISPVMEADVVLSQPQPGMLTVRTTGGAATVRLVA